MEKKTSLRVPAREEWNGKKEEQKKIYLWEHTV